MNKPSTPGMDELRKEIWGALPNWSHPPEPCTAQAPCEDLCKRSVDAIMAAVQLTIEQERLLAMKFMAKRRAQDYQRHLKLQAHNPQVHKGKEEVKK